MALLRCKLNYARALSPIAIEIAALSASTGSNIPANQFSVRKHSSPTIYSSAPRTCDALLLPMEQAVIRIRKALNLF